MEILIQPISNYILSGSGECNVDISCIDIECVDIDVCIPDN